MASVSFSLTERVIVDPVLTMRAPLPPTDQDEPHELIEEAWQIFQSEVLARIVSAFTSVFATADAFTHLLVGSYKGADLLLRTVFSLTPATWSSSEVYSHFQRAAWFGGFTIIGSLAGIIYPDALRPCRYTPSSPPSDDDDISTPRAETPPRPESDRNISEALRQLAHSVKTGGERNPYIQLRQFWSQSSLENKHWFVHTFSRNVSENFKGVRMRLADIVYRPISRQLRERQIQWLSGQEIDQRVNCLFGQANEYNQATFFHATNEKSLESILKSKKVEVHHEKALRGAFVSTQPEVGFGRYILAFRRSIERLSSLEHGFTVDQNIYWAGFSHDIPVTDATLAYIILDKGTNTECRVLQERCHQWTGRSINVISLEDVATTLNTIQRLGTGIPIEWPDEDARTGQKILNTLRARAAIAVPQVQPQMASQPDPIYRTSFRRRRRVPLHHESRERTPILA